MGPLEFLKMKTLMSVHLCVWRARKFGFGLLKSYLTFGQLTCSVGSKKMSTLHPKYPLTHTYLSPIPSFPSKPIPPNSHLSPKSMTFLQTCRSSSYLHYLSPTPTTCLPYPTYLTPYLSYPFHSLPISLPTRNGNSLIGFLSKSLVFCDSLKN